MNNHLRKIAQRPFLILCLLGAASALCNEPIDDPIKDFLYLSVSDRYTDSTEITSITTFQVDLNNDGSDELFVGHHKMWWGDNTGLYCSVYARLNDSWRRLTPPDSEVRIDPRFFGERSTTFVGDISEIQNEALLVLSNDFYSEKPNKFASSQAFLIEGEQLVIKELGVVDLDTKEGIALYRKYFGEDVMSRAVHIDVLDIDELRKLGYVVPVWKTQKLQQSRDSPSAKQGSLETYAITGLGAGLEGSPSGSAESLATSAHPTYSKGRIAFFVIFAGVVAVVSYLLFTRRHKRHR